MKHNIDYYIRQVLREHRRVGIPNIGTIYLKQSPANFSADKKMLFPPELKLEFSTDLSDADTLPRYIADTEKFSIEKATKKIEKYANTAFNNLLNVDSTVIEGVGEIKKDNFNKFSIAPNLRTLTREFNALGALVVKPINRFKEQQTAIATSAAAPVVAIPAETDTPVLETTEEKKKSRPWWIPILAGLLLGAVYIWVDANLDKQDAPATSAKTEEQTSESRVATAQEEQEISTTDLPIIEDTSERVNEEYREIDEIVSDLYEETVVEQIEAKEKERANIIAEKPTVEDVLPKDRKEMFANDEMKLFATSPNNKFADIIPDNGQCIIITGSFLKTSAIVDMLNRIERAGYRTYSRESGTRTRVGIRFDCTNVDLDAFMRRVRRDFAKDAWFLVPNHTVPF